MPANLNALIRYKTINSCLYGGTRRWSITELGEKCSTALAEYRGRYDPISERTIRDDIRIMRSDILGYNAPIEQQKGLYYYADPDYSIMTLSFTDAALIDRIVMFLGEIKSKVSHPELEIILEKLAKLQMKHHLEESVREEMQTYPASADFSFDKAAEESPEQIKISGKAKASERVRFSLEEPSLHMAPAPSSAGDQDQITWGIVMRALFSWHRSQFRDR